MKKVEAETVEEFLGAHDMLRKELSELIGQRKTLPTQIVTHIRESNIALAKAKEFLNA